MLSRIEIRNFAIIQSLDLDWSEGMTVITGETGAGKSIVIDALGLTLGEKAEQSVIYPNAKQAEVTAIFDLTEKSAATKWLAEHDLNEEDECILRRVVVNGGKSRCFINGRTVTQSQLKNLARLLVDIHGQHAHQTLMHTKEQLYLLDRYANNNDLLRSVSASAQQINEIQKRKKILEQEKEARDAKFELLSYQVEELANANPETSLLNTLEQEHQIAATSQDRLLLTQSGLQWLKDDDNYACLSLLNKTQEQVTQLCSMDKNAANISEILIQAESLLQEAYTELSNYGDKLDSDPEKLNELDEQLSMFHDLARKHHVDLKQLPEHFEQLQAELTQLQSDESELQQIANDYQNALQDYQQKAQKLSQSRQKTAKKLQKLITQKIQGLAMDGGKFEIQIIQQDQQISAIGMDSVTFMVSANPGQPLQPLNKVASGGELSRISLAIAVITAEQQLVPCIIFDEVDVGIGGGTAETVGHLLNELSTNRQVICVTHQPQVAACGDQHLVASKTKLTNSTITKVKQLDQQQRIEEIGRMLGGLIISDKTLSHAKEMLGV
ncbi:DNA repair protein RecN [Aliikangiella sp. IMCC44359]|uniref:DNA repair protein RecN n=1 Tax=Aliikangiella sp. IMCC44359 TaxID=3459125 RepID=UPI00403ADEFE